MRDDNGLDRADLDRWITGNYGEDAFRDEEEPSDYQEEPPFCEFHGRHFVPVRGDRSGGPLHCPDCTAEAKGDAAYERWKDREIDRGGER